MNALVSFFASAIVIPVRLDLQENQSINPINTPDGMDGIGGQMKTFCKLTTQSPAASYVPLPRFLLQDEALRDISNDAKVLYALLLDRASISRQNGYVEPDGTIRLYFTLEQAQTKLHRSRQSATRIFRELEYSGLIVRRKQGLGKPALITLNYPSDAKFIAKEGEDAQA